MIRRQEEVGLKSVTDGEFRRVSWNYDFLERLDGVESYAGERKIKFSTGPAAAVDAAARHRQARRLRAASDDRAFQVPEGAHEANGEMTIPSPSSLHFRYGRDAVPETIYPVDGGFLSRPRRVVPQGVRAFADAGCRYLQLDEVNLAYLCDPSLRELIAPAGKIRRRCRTSMPA